MSRHLCFYNNDTLLQDNTEPGYFTEFAVPADTNLIVCYDDDYKITCNIRVTASSNQDMINYQFGTDSAIFLLKSLQNYTQNQTVRAQITVSNIAKDSNNLSQDIQNYLQTCGVGSGSSIDFSTIVTALNSIATALSALTNLSNLSNLTQLANIITAIQKKDNQSDLVDTLKNIFLINNNGVLIDIFTGHRFDNPSSNSFNSLANIINKLRNVFLTSNVSASNDVNLNQRLLAPLLTLCDYQTGEGQTAVIPDNVNLVMKYSNLLHIQNKINDIETKLEQNLPFTTIVENDIVETNIAQNCSYGSKIEQIPFS